MIEHWSGLASGVVSRLRLSFLLIALVLTISVLWSLSQLANLRESVRALTTSSVAVFVKSEETGRSLTNLLLLLQNVSEVQDQQRLGMLELQLDERLSNLRLDLTALAEMENNAGVSLELFEALQLIESTASFILQDKADIITHRANLDLLIANLSAPRDSIRASLEDLAFTRNALEQSNRLQVEGISPSAISDLERRFSRDLLISGTITSITLEVDAILDRAVNLPSASRAAALFGAESEIRFKFQTITSQLGQVDVENTRVQLAIDLLNLRDIILGPEGMMREAKALLELQEALSGHLQNQLQPVQDISTLSSELTRQARDAMTQANIAVSENLNRLSFVMRFTEVAVLLIILATLLLVVERQINKRMFKLKTAVLSIASGTWDYDVDVDGTDEIGKMADALEIFKANAAELARSNAELETFAYVAAHDLRSPLRGIHDLAEWIVEDDENKLSEDSHEFLSLLVGRVTRMNALLSDLLNYSLVGQEEDSFSSVCLSDVIEDTAQLLDPNNSFNITFKGPREDIVTIATPLRQILHNLISNCIKHHDRKTGSITVTSFKMPFRIHFIIRDDGPGIEQKYHEKVFELFQTLKPRDEVEGSGLGLAIIRKLVQHHGGTITLQSSPTDTRGTAFEFDLPMQSQTALATQTAA